MKEDKDFRSMMDSIESQKERGYPSGSSHFAKMQCIGGAKPGNIGRDKNWPMPDKIPDAKENHQHLEKTDDSIKETSDAKAADETKSQKKIKPVNTEAKAAFDNMMDHPMDQLNSIMDQTFPNRNKTTHKEASVKLKDGTRPFKDMMIEKGKKSRENQKKLGESESLPEEKITFSNEGDSNLNQMAEGYVNDPNIKEALNQMANAPTEIPDTRGEIISTDDGEDFDEDVYQDNIDYHGKKGDLSSGKWGVKLANLPYFMDRHISMENAFKTLINNGYSREEAANMVGYAARAALDGDRKSLPNHYYESPITSHKQASATKELPSFKDVMAFKKMLDIGQMTGMDSVIDQMYAKPATTQTTFDAGPNSFYSTKQYLTPETEKELYSVDNLGNGESSISTDVAEDQLHAKAAEHDKGKEHLSRAERAGSESDEDLFNSKFEPKTKAEIRRMRDFFKKYEYTSVPTETPGLFKIVLVPRDPNRNPEEKFI